MEIQTKNSIDLLTLNISVAFLLAREAHSTDVPLRHLQEAMISEYVKNAQNLDQSPAALEVEVALTNSVDHLFGMAAGLLRSMDQSH